jgi:hypothetical protein
MTTASSYSIVVQELYISYFGRPADFNGLQNFEGALAAANAPTDLVGLNAVYATNSTVKALIDSFGTSAESVNLYGTISNSSNATAFVTAVFENLFNRAPAAAGLAFWTSALTSGNLVSGDAALAIAAGAATNQTSQGYSDSMAVAAKAEVASEFTDMLNTPAAISSYSGSAAAATVRALIATVGTSAFDTSLTDIQQVVATLTHDTDTVFNLSTGTDNLQGAQGNNIFNAILDNAAGVAAGGPVATLTTGDSIVAGPNLNILNIVDYGVNSHITALPSALTGITTLNVTSNESFSVAPTDGTYNAGLLDLSAWIDLQNINIISNGDVSLVAPAKAAVSITSLYEYVSLQGGSIISIMEPIYNGDGSNSIQGGMDTSSIVATGGTEYYIRDLNSGTGKQNSITSVALNYVSGIQQIYSDALTSLTLAGSSTTSAQTDIYAAAGTRALTLTLNGDLFGQVSDPTATALYVDAIGSTTNGFSLNANAAKTITFNDQSDLILSQSYGAPLHAADATAVTITGPGAFTCDLTGLNASAAIDATAATGIVSVSLSAGESFHGGAGQCVVTISAIPTVMLTGGSAGDDEIILNNFTSGSTVSGTTTGTFDMSKLTSYNGFDVQSVGGSVSFINSMANSSVNLEGANGTVTVQTADANGAHDSVAVNINDSTVAVLTLEDRDSNGPGTINLASNALIGSPSGFEQNSVIKSLEDNSLAVLNLSGNSQLNITTPITDQSTSLAINNAAGTIVSTFSGLTDNNLSNLIFNGSEPITFMALVGTSSILSVTDNNAAAVNITNFNDTALTSASFANTQNSVTAIFNIGSLNETGLTTLTLAGNVPITVGTYMNPDMVASGITVSGASDNAPISFFSAGATAAGKADNITLGNGYDSITLGPGVAGSTQNIALGTGIGDNIYTSSTGTVNVNIGGTFGNQAFTNISLPNASSIYVNAGNGNNDIGSTAEGASFSAVVGSGSNVIFSQGAGDTVNIATGSGGNRVATGAGAIGKITFGTHTADIGDSAIVGSLTSIGGIPNLANIISISGLNNAGSDSITFSDVSTGASSNIQQITAANVTVFGGSTTSLASWIAAAVGQGGIVPQSAHGISWFQFSGNTYIVETVATTDAGSIRAADSVVELIGTNYAFSHSSFTYGTLNLQG